MRDVSSGDRSGGRRKREGMAVSSVLQPGVSAGSGVERHLGELERAAREARLAQEFGAYAALMKQIAELRGYLRAPPAEEAVSAEEQARLVTEEAARLGMVWPGGGGDGG